ncbi:MAG: IS200/IS605 family transposase [Candidatus Brocadia sp.]|nr:IS200/IS605 family transposase [Candidatus Brocadia sp.]MDG6027509.1 IS200/IS605 family transposase [Candidatus Brocadia sp.]
MNNRWFSPERAKGIHVAGTFTFLGMHFVFSTKNRVPLLDTTMNERLFSYIGGIIRELSGKLVEINAMPEHIHFYAYMPKTVSVSKFMEMVKANSSKWVHNSFPNKDKFGWQDGYGAFTVSKSAEDTVIDYIRNQQEHHRKKSFQAEFTEFLNKYGIEYDKNYLWK